MLCERHYSETEKTSYGMEEKDLHISYAVKDLYLKNREFSMLSLKSPIRKWERRLEQTFTEQGIQMASKSMERC